MAHYIANKEAQPSGEHEVHNEDTCNNLPDTKNRQSIGYYTSCKDAIAAAREKWTNTFDGCKHCCPDCHTS